MDSACFDYLLSSLSPVILKCFELELQSSTRSDLDQIRLFVEKPRNDNKKISRASRLAVFKERNGTSLTRSLTLKETSRLSSFITKSIRMAVFAYKVTAHGGKPLIKDPKELARNLVSLDVDTSVNDSEPLKPYLALKRISSVITAKSFISNNARERHS